MEISLPKEDTNKIKTKNPVGPHTASRPPGLALFLLEKRLSPRPFLPTYHGLKSIYFSQDAYAYIHITVWGKGQGSTPSHREKKRQSFSRFSSLHNCSSGVEISSNHFRRLRNHVLWRRHTMGERIPLKSDLHLTEKPLAEGLDLFAPNHQACHGQGGQSRRKQG